MDINNIENNNKCRVCHQPILPTYYFCPNCGTKLITAPLSVSFSTQLGIYLFSIILPALCFLFISKWPGLKYIRSNNQKAKWVGVVALILLLISTIVLGWLAYVGTQNLAESIDQALNVDLGIYGF
jgi:hypothetical protein